MQLKIFSIRDQKSESYGNPWYKLTHGEAERDFRSAVNDEKLQLHKYPEDFDLWYLGTFDTDSGKFDSLPTPQHIIKAVNCLDNKHQPTL